MLCINKNPKVYIISLDGRSLETTKVSSYTKENIDLKTPYDLYAQNAIQFAMEHITKFYDFLYHWQITVLYENQKCTLISVEKGLRA